MKNGLKVLIIADAFADLSLAMIGPIYAIFVAQIGGDILDVGWAFFTFTFTSGVVLYLMGKWEDRIKHKEKLVIIGYAVLSVGAGLYLFVDSKLTLFITQTVLGFGLALVSPAFDALYSHFIKSNKEASEWGLWEAMGYIVSAFGALLGAYAVKFYGFKIFFIIMFAISLVGTMASLFLLKGEEYLNRE